MAACSWAVESAVEAFSSHALDRPINMFGALFCWQIARCRQTIFHIQLLRMLREAPLDLYRLSGLVKRDASLTYRLLRLVNSPACAVRQEVRSIQSALLAVGDDCFAASLPWPSRVNSTAPNPARFCAWHLFEHVSASKPQVSVLSMRPNNICWECSACCRPCCKRPWQRSSTRCRCKRRFAGPCWASPSTSAGCCNGRRPASAANGRDAKPSRSRTAYKWIACSIVSAKLLCGRTRLSSPKPDGRLTIAMRGGARLPSEQKALSSAAKIEVKGPPQMPNRDLSSRTRSRATVSCVGRASFSVTMTLPANHVFTS